MAQNPTTTNIAVYKDVAERLRSLAASINMTALEVASQLLRQGMDQNEVKMEVKTLVLQPKGGGRKPVKRG